MTPDPSPRAAFPLSGSLGRRTMFTVAELDLAVLVASVAPDEQIRSLREMMPMPAAPQLDAEATERYAKLLVTEGNEDGRDAAAHNLSLSQDKAKVLELFARTLETEPAVCVGWALFRFSARVAGKDALPVMANMAIQDMRFQPVYQDFERISASGVLDFVRVWNSLPNADPFGCLALSMNLQEWSLILREKQRLQQAP